ncbi:TonB-dependent receptor [Flammeovirga sp. EKP202]|uniref:TonB-dependent receptor n=1 Tax=Flammeovirga sp. EKP202 TaxID=2770592 RepID=UPI00165F1DB4|nr:TonB-dependent receptor [Flammeovirga sp. EKP202]MBD0405404.1 TonB-dependent receptor [Flammeovirga sp. EKP202]
MKNNFNSYIFSTLLTLFSLQLFAGNPIKIKGHITSGKEHVPFVNISINDGQFGTTSDETGHFIIELEKGETYHLTVTTVGYKTMEMDWVANAQNELHIELQKDLLELNEVIVSSNRRAQSRNETSSVVNVIGKDLFQSANFKVAGEGLNYVSGARVETTCGNCGSSELRLNGLEGPYTQILIDSRPVFNGLVGVYGLEQIPVNMVDQIEIVRGGGSVLFGANAIGGTVNILTKSPKFNAYEVGSNFSSMNGEVNDYNVYFNTSLVSKNEKTSGYLFGSYRNRDAWNANPDDIYYKIDDDGNPYGDPIKDDFSEVTALETISVGTKIYHQFNDQNKFTFDAKFINDQRRGGNKFDRPYHETDLTEAIEMNIGSASLAHDWFSKDKKWHLNTYAIGQFVDRDSYYGAHQAPDGYGSTTGSTIIAGSQMNYNIGKVAGGKSVLVVGAEFIHDRINDKKLAYLDEETGEWTNDATVSDQNSNTYALFAQQEWTNDKWSLLTGVRMDYVDITDLQNHENDKNVPAINPRVNLKYKILDNLQIRGGFATGFRAPQMFSEDLHIEVTSGQGVRTVLDPDLKSETSISYNLALDLDQQIGKTQFYFLVEGFHTTINDRFDNQYDYQEDGTLILFKRNSTSNAVVKGLNFETKIAPSESFMIQANYTLQSSQYDEENQWGDEDSSTSKEILRTPNQYGSLTANYKITNQWEASLTGVYTGKMYVPYLPGGFINGELTENEELIESEQFVDMGIKLAYTTKLTKDTNIQIGAGVKNIFNQMQSNFVSGIDKDAGFVYGPYTPRTFYIDVRIGNLLN